jgi:hypothetical protein
MTAWAGARTLPALRPAPLPLAVRKRERGRPKEARDDGLGRGKNTPRAPAGSLSRLRGRGGEGARPFAPEL